MRILFDQNVPRKLRLFLRAHLVMTANQMGWAELSNGDLIGVAERAGFEVMVTADQSIFYQQNNCKRTIALVVLTRQKEVEVLRHGDEVAAAVSSAMPGSYATVQIMKGPSQSRNRGV